MRESRENSSSASAPIWFRKDVSLEQIRPLGKGTMSEFLGIEWLELGTDFLRARMPVNERTRQPYGLLHGGASCVLAETIGSVAAAMVIDHNRFLCLGLEINANHVRGVRTGFVTGTATPLHLGSSTQVWDIRITDEQDRLVCISRLTVGIVRRKDQSS
ncbi:MAG TPA: hotdog fold thioesterase [Chitinophagaceae bacterium]|nr:hotdog fold thioesterase [Chitinophagaceae bacterium]